MEPTKHRVRKLRLDAPLMSTRRPYALTRDASKANISSRYLSPHESTRGVPFLWERAPGVPKHVHSDKEAMAVMPPKPPPGRCRPSTEDANTNDADVRNPDGSDHEVYSDAPDDLSLSQYSGNIGCRISIDQPSALCKTPSFIMDRFLTAANALAAASSVGIPKYIHSKQQAVAPSYSHRLQREMDMIMPRPSRTQIHSTTKPCIEASPSKTCGINTPLLIPWRLKSTVCGYKSPVRSQTPRASLDSGLRIRTTKRCVSDGLSSEMDGGVSGTGRKSVGWGLPFLDTSRLRLRGRSSVDGGKWKDFIVGRKPECGSERSMKRADAERRRAACNLPQLKSPSEPWLSHAVNSVNKRF